MKVLVAGSGGWGTALAMVLHRNGNQVFLWSYCQEESDHLKKTHRNPFLPGVDLPEEMIFTSHCEDAAEADMVVFASPSFAVRATAKSFAPYLREDAVIVCVTKGIEQGTGCRMTQVIGQETGRTVVALSGPSHAEEVSRQIPTGVVAACEDKLHRTTHIEECRIVPAVSLCRLLRLNASDYTIVTGVLKAKTSCHN